jgi:hypothetical protein
MAKTRWLENNENGEDSINRIPVQAEKALHSCPNK